MRIATLQCTLSVKWQSSCYRNPMLATCCQKGLTKIQLNVTLDSKDNEVNEMITHQNSNSCTILKPSLLKSALLLVPVAALQRKELI